MLGAEMIIGGKVLAIKDARWAVSRRAPRCVHCLLAARGTMWHCAVPSCLQVEVVTTLPSGMDGTPHYDICGGSLIKVTHVLTAGHCVP